MAHTYQYPRAALTVDCVVFGLDESELKVLLIERALEPFKGKWALPGGFVRVDETLDEAARRELGEEAGLKDVFLEQLYTFGDGGSRSARTRRERGLLRARQAGGSRHQGRHRRRGRPWFPISKVPKLAFDHAEILATALARLKGKVRYQPIGFELLPPKFTLSQLQHLYEAVLGTELDKRNFRKKVLSFGLLVPLKETQMTGRHRPAQLFRFDADKYEKLKKRGFNFEV